MIILSNLIVRIYQFMSDHRAAGFCNDHDIVRTGERMVESKSLKLYLFSFRNHGDFHEDCVNVIMKDLIKLMDPKYIEVWGKFTPRGGISIDPYCNYGRPDTKWEQMAEKRMLWHDMYPEKLTIDNSILYRKGFAVYTYTANIL